MKLGKLFVAILLAGVMTGACTQVSSPGSPISDFPLNMGTTWTYSYSEYQATLDDPTRIITARLVLTDTVADTQTSGQFFIAHVKRSTHVDHTDPGWFPVGGSGGLDRWYVIAGQKVYISGQQPEDSNIQTDSMPLVLDLPLEVGKSWCMFQKLKGAEVSDCTGSGKVSVDALENLNTSAGRFKDCVQMTQWFNDGNILQKFCPGVGLVSEKFDHSGTRFGFERTLTGYSRGGAGSISTFQLIALLLAAAWLLLVAVRFHRSTLVLLIGLVVLGLFTLVEFLLGNVTAKDLGLSTPTSWLTTVLFALTGLAVTLAYSPLADRIASRFFPQPPDLGAFKPVQRSWLSLVIGILIAWLLGGFLEELIARGFVLNSIEALLAPLIGTLDATVVAILVAAAGAGVMHAYQGSRAMLIIGQLSVLFGVLFVLSGHNLWVVIIAHGLYDTIAFIRFALKKSRYSDQ